MLERSLDQFAITAKRCSRALPLVWFQAWYTKTTRFDFAWLNEEFLHLNFKLPLQLGARTYALHLIWKVIVGVLLFYVFGRVFGPHIMRLARWRKTFKQTVLAARLSVVGLLLARLHLLTIDKLYPAVGRKRPLAGKRSSTINR
jgi:hypothetical protein